MTAVINPRRNKNKRLSPQPFRHPQTLNMGDARFELLTEMPSRRSAGLRTCIGTDEMRSADFTLTRQGCQ